jgi:ribulose-5-phosphate 4-epimerase/fuculose-1-phosphate aldolase
MWNLARSFAAALLGAALLLLSPMSHAQEPPPPPPVSAGPVEPALIEDLVAASRILVDQGVLDAFGHVSVRHPKDPNRFLMSRSLAPALVTAEDIVEHDLDGRGIDANGRSLFLERFIHAEIYRARPDVNAIVHSHSPSVIPFSVVKRPMRAMYHNAGFLAQGIPVFDIRKRFGMTNMLVSNSEIGKALAADLGDKPVALMRGHGSVAVAPSLPLAVFRAVYTEVNAKLQTQALSIGGPVTYLEPEEGALADKTNAQVVGRPWELWKRKALGK